jgi:hypothetical protein
MGVGTALAIGGMAMSAYSMYEQGKQADYNSKVAEMAGKAESDAIKSNARRLSWENRKQRATNRVALAAGGAGMGDQPLMLLAEEANQMQMDQLELQRQAVIAQQYGSAQSLMARLQGRSQMLSQGASLLGSGYQAYNTWLDGRPVEPPKDD